MALKAEHRKSIVDFWLSEPMTLTRCASQAGVDAGTVRRVILDALGPDALKHIRRGPVPGTTKPNKLKLAILADADSGQFQTFAEIARRNGVSGEYVRQILLKHCRDAPGSIDQKRRHEAILSAARKGMYSDDIAQAIGVSVHQVRSVARASGVTLRRKPNPAPVSCRYKAVWREGMTPMELHKLAGGSFQSAHRFARSRGYEPVCKDGYRRASKPTKAETQDRLSRMRKMAAGGLTLVEAARLLGVRRVETLRLLARTHKIKFQKLRDKPRKRPDVAARNKARKRS